MVQVGICPCYRIRYAPADGGGGSPPGGCPTAALLCVSAGAFGWLPAMVVEVVPSHVAAVLSALVYSCFFPVRPASQCLLW
jgi:hypothetical protein